jgi:chromosome segregation ATPase
MSQKTLAADASKLGVKLLQTTVAKIEAEQRDVRLGEAWALARALGVRFDSMVGGLDEGSYSLEELAQIVADVDDAVAEAKVRMEQAELEVDRLDAARDHAKQRESETYLEYTRLADEAMELGRQLERRRQAESNG